MLVLFWASQGFFPLKKALPLSLWAFTHLGSVWFWWINNLCHTSGYSLGSLNLERWDSRTGEKYT